ncbi:YciK family oxidoreductase [Alteromonas sp. a30]|uniref:YciK family oxidoreductase n=1 Tax=Alteromonas sp. a30 TaxID=2730917 RepID=UPI0022831DC6|nr:YciK family oxidoreductase [Alteromonas sp. a30]MCY7294121.1 YciK family oxidoreductase [Alteromonas sp. a30]
MTLSIHDFNIPKDIELNNKTILVTGAGDGIGKVASLTFASQGATVILLGRTVAKLEQVYDEIMQAGGPEPAIVPLDLNGATQRHYREMAATIESQFGKLDGVLHNASLLGDIQPFAQISEKQFNEVMQVNLNSTFLMTQALLPALTKADTASVIFTSSGVGNQGRAYWGTYAISKFATEGMMQTLADEYSNTPLRFNCINPGATRTAMRAKAFPAEDRESVTPPEALMPLYSFLMSDESKSVTGKTIKAQ